MYDLQKEINKAISKYREQNDVSIAYLAAQMDLDRSTLSRKLAGFRKWQILDLQALHALGIIHISTEIDYGDNK